MRHCNGQDPNLLRPTHDPVELCPDPHAPQGLDHPMRICIHYKPCNCGCHFDDVKYITIYPHPAIRKVLL